MAIDMNFESCSNTMESEFIGQSVDVATHKCILERIKEHILTTAMQMSGKLIFQ